jgi:hypothetical protein
MWQGRGMIKKSLKTIEGYKKQIMQMPAVDKLNRCVKLTVDK